MLLIVLVIAAIVVGRQVLRQQDFPDQWVVSGSPDPSTGLTSAIAAANGGLHRQHVRPANLRVISPLRELLTALPWWMVCLGAAVAAYAAARRVTLAILSFVCIAVIGFVGAVG